MAILSELATGFRRANFAYDHGGIFINDGPLLDDYFDRLPTVINDLNRELDLAVAWHKVPALVCTLVSERGKFSPETHKSPLPSSWALPSPLPYELSTLSSWG